MYGNGATVMVHSSPGYILPSSAPPDLKPMECGPRSAAITSSTPSRWIVTNWMQTLCWLSLKVRIFIAIQEEHLHPSSCCPGRKPGCRDCDWIRMAGLGCEQCCRLARHPALSARRI